MLCDDQVLLLWYTALHFPTYQRSLQQTLESSLSYGCKVILILIISGNWIIKILLV